MGNTVGIVGGGAAGMMAAITAARNGERVTLLERNDRLGKKILSTGNGKCNLGNERLEAEAYYTGRPDMLEDFLGRFGTEDTISFFQSIGLLIKSRNGYLYPASEQAAAVLDVLRYEVKAAGVDVVTDFKAESVERGRRSKLLQVYGKEGVYSFDRVILACGGKAAPKTGSDGSGYRLAEQLGHSMVPVVPALVQLRCREEYLKSVSGVRADAQISVWFQGKRAAQERGEMQLTEYGISGIPVFQLSRRVNYILAGAKKPAEVEVNIDFLPDYTEEDFRMQCTGRRLLQGHRTVEEFFTGMLHKKLMLLFIKLAGLKSAEAVSGADERKLARVYELCRCWKLHVIGSNSYDNAQVCAGGVPLDEVTESLESRLVPGVYFAGEILDVDGRCGGYNLQWAWCSGFIAGKHHGGSGVMQSRAPRGKGQVV